MQSDSMTFEMPTFKWFLGVVEDRHDPKKLGRVKVRLFGFHTENKSHIPTESLFWYHVMSPVTSAAMNGIGLSTVGMVEGTWVIGFFRDNDDFQDGIIMGTLQGIPQERLPDTGFYDPNNFYPKDEFIGEQDFNRLARNEKIDKTCVQIKKDNRRTKIERSLGKSEWNEPAVPDNREYPYNHVRESELGIVEEWDDTKGSRRHHLFHPSGTFKEIHDDGKVVYQYVNDKYKIVYGDDNVSIEGNCNLTINGDSNILIKGDSNIETRGNFNHKVNGNYQLKVSGNYTLSTTNCYIDSAFCSINGTTPPITF